MAKANKQPSSDNQAELPTLLDPIDDTIPLNKIIELRNKRLSFSEIGKILGCTKQNISQRLQPLLNEVDNLKSFKENKADILAVQQARLLNHLTTEDIKKSSAYQKVGMFSVLHNQERLERGESTANIAYADLSGKLEEVQAKRKALEVELGIQDSPGTEGDSA